MSIVRTVELHLTRIYAKFGISSRSAVAERHPGPHPGPELQILANSRARTANAACMTSVAVVSGWITRVSTESTKTIQAVQRQEMGEQGGLPGGGPREEADRSAPAPADLPL